MFVKDMRLEEFVSDIYLKLSLKYGNEFQLKVIDEGQGANTLVNKLMYFQNSENTQYSVNVNKQSKIITYTKEIQLIVQTNENHIKLAEDVLMLLFTFTNDITYDINTVNAFKDATQNDLKKLGINYIIYTFTYNKKQLKK